MVTFRECVDMCVIVITRGFHDVQSWSLTICICYVSCRGHLPSVCRLLHNGYNEVLPPFPEVEPYHQLFLCRAEVTVRVSVDLCVMIIVMYFHDFHCWSLLPSVNVMCHAEVTFRESVEFCVIVITIYFHHFQSWSLLPSFVVMCHAEVKFWKNAEMGIIVRMRVLHHFQSWSLTICYFYMQTSPSERLQTCV